MDDISLFFNVNFFQSMPTKHDLNSNRLKTDQFGAQNPIWHPFFLVKLN